MILKEDLELQRGSRDKLKSALIVSTSSAGFHAGNYAIIKLNDYPITIIKNNHNHYRGLHIAILNPHNGHVEFAKAFDTYKNGDSFDKFIDFALELPVGYIIVAACKDDCVTALSVRAKCWFAFLGSSEMWQLKYRESWAFIGQTGKDDNFIEKRGDKKNHGVSVTQVFVIDATASD